MGKHDCNDIEYCVHISNMWTDINFSNIILCMEYTNADTDAIHPAYILHAHRAMPAKNYMHNIAAMQDN